MRDGARTVSRDMGASGASFARGPPAGDARHGARHGAAVAAQLLRGWPHGPAAAGHLECRERLVDGAASGGRRPAAVARVAVRADVPVVAGVRERAPDRTDGGARLALSAARRRDATLPR